MSAVLINRRGQMRTVEALIASGIMAVAMWSMISLTRYPEPYVGKMRKELVRECYDYLISMAEEEVFDKVIFYDNGTIRGNWEGLMKNVLNALLPPNILYNMTVLNMTQGGEIFYREAIYEKTLNKEALTNASPEDFRLAEMSSAEITYTTRNRWVLKIHLDLAVRW
ncbi:MAG: hypothetical protein ACUVQ0_04055 [Thermoproteota archaeon]